jgi:predicted DNA-binding transcriptional regulator YafY
MHTDSKGNYTGSSTSAIANVYEFNVSDPAIIKKLQEAMTEGKVVKLSYRQWLMSPPSIENSHVIVAVEDLE